MSRQSVPLSTQPTPAGSGPRRGWENVSVVGSHIFESARMAIAQQRPWSQLLDCNALVWPNSLADASSRMKKNLHYFRMNYICFVALAISLNLFFHPVSFTLFFLLLAAWIFLYFLRAEPIVLFNRTLGDKEILIILGIATMLVFYTNIGSTVLTSVAIASAIIAVHAAFRNTDDLYLEEDENVSTSFPIYSDPSPSTKLSAVI